MAKLPYAKLLSKVGEITFSAFVFLYLKIQNFFRQLQILRGKLSGKSMTENTKPLVIDEDKLDAFISSNSEVTHDNFLKSTNAAIKCLETEKNPRKQPVVEAAIRESFRYVAKQSLITGGGSMKIVGHDAIEKGEVVIVIKRSERPFSALIGFISGLLISLLLFQGVIAEIYIFMFVFITTFASYILSKGQSIKKIKKDRVLSITRKRNYAAVYYLNGEDSTGATEMKTAK